MNIAGLILSGGSSRRMGSPKALLTIGAETFLDRLIRVFAPVCSPVVVVLGPHGPQILNTVLRKREGEFVFNDDPERGMLSSLQTGLETVPNADAVIFTPVDYPGISASTISALASAFAQNLAPVTLPVHDGKRGHPVCVSRAVAGELLAAPVTAQARDIIRAHRPRTCFVNVTDPGILADIDDPADYSRFLSDFIPAQTA